MRTLVTTIETKKLHEELINGVNSINSNALENCPSNVSVAFAKTYTTHIPQLIHIEKNTTILMSHPV